MNRNLLLVGSVVLLAVAGLAVGALRDPPTRQAAVDPHGTALPAQREVQLSSTMPSPSTYDGLHARLVTGAMPSAPAQATVLTDEECQPDDRGISHCLNRLRLTDGGEIQVRHPHDMAQVPCLAPGEQVRLVPSFS